MITSANTISKNTTIKRDVCVIGAGAAGITLAREFNDQNVDVCLLESGGLDFDETTQSLYKGENIGLPYRSLDENRLRYFGGTTNHWAGYCRPLDEIDFLERSWVPNSGWPFRKAHLDPFYSRAHPVCQLGPYNYDYKSDEWKDPDYDSTFPLGQDKIEVSMYQVSPPTRFGQVYREELKSSKNVLTILHSNVLDIELEKGSRSVHRLHVASIEGNSFWVSAKVFVLATGGVENARLLLLSNSVEKNGLGNHHDLVGRYFMEHPGLSSGTLLVRPDIATTFFNVNFIKGVRVQRCLALSPEIQEREQLLPYCAVLHQEWTEAAQSEGVYSMKMLRDAIAERKMPEEFWTHVGNVIWDIDSVAERLYEKYKGIRLSKYRLWNHIEQVPNPDSRVVLGEDLDQLGRRRAQLNWRLTELEKKTIRRGQEIIAQEFGKHGLGRLQMSIDDDDASWVSPAGLKEGVSGPGASMHHMGTTRMHADPKKGVVDPDCKVHGVSNLFVAGSSVFPAGGYANPTLTIVALAIRLGDHLKKITKGK